jgi:hypothetical protein
VVLDADAAVGQGTEGQVATRDVVLVLLRGEDDARMVSPGGGEELIRRRLAGALAAKFERTPQRHFTDRFVAG